MALCTEEALPTSQSLCADLITSLVVPKAGQASPPCVLLVASIMISPGTAASVAPVGQIALEMAEGHIVVSDPAVAFKRAKQWYISVNTALLTHDYLAGLYLRLARVFNLVCAIGNTVIASAIFTAIGTDGCSSTGLVQDTC